SKRLISFLQVGCGAADGVDQPVEVAALGLVAVVEHDLVVRLVAGGEGDLVVARVDAGDLQGVDALGVPMPEQLQDAAVEGDDGRAQADLDRLIGAHPPPPAAPWMASASFSRSARSSSLGLIGSSIP